MRYILALLVFVALVFVSCESTVAPGTPSVTYAPTDNGGMLRLTWPAVTDAEGYNIYLDEVKDTSITGTGTLTVDVAGPAKKVEVSAYNGSEESGFWTLDLTPISTPTLTAYGASDPDPLHPSGLALKDAGAVALAIGEAANKPDIDYVFDDRGSFTPMSMVNPGDYDPQINSKGNAISLVTSGQFDDEDFALAPGNYDTKRIPVTQNGVYYLWLDRNNNNYSTDDNFAKIQIISISGTVVTAKVAYQKVPGLRWVVTP